MRKDPSLQITLSEIRGRLSNDMLLVFALSSIPALATLLYRVQDVGWSAGLSIHIAIAVLFWCLYLFRNRLKTLTKTVLLLGLFYAIGVVGYFGYGLSGVGPQFIVMFVIVTTLFWGLRIGLAAFALSELFVIGLGLAVTRRWVSFGVDFNRYSTAPSSWIVQIVAMGLFTLLVLVIINRLYTALVDALGLAREQTGEAERKAAELQEEIAERNRAEEALRESERQYRALVDFLPIAIFHIEDAGNLVAFNRKALELFGYDQEDYRQGMNALQFFPPEERPRVGEKMAKVLQGASLPGHEFTFLRKDGAAFAGLIYASPDIQRNRPVGIKGAIIDISERKEVEKALRKSEERYRALIENAGDIIFKTDAAGRFTFMNPAGIRMIGYEEGEVIGKEYFTLVRPDMREEVMKFYGRQFVTKQQDSYLELPVLTKEGREIWLGQTVSLLTDDGHVCGFQAIARDITDIKKAEEENRTLAERLNRAEKMQALGQLAGGVAHDLNNVLGILSGYSELLLDEIPEGNRARVHVEKILQSTERGAAIIQDLLTLARRGVLSSDVINLNTVVSDFLKTPMFEKIQEYHPRIAFRTECDKNLLNIKGSLVHLEKSLMNLMSNAAESISGEGAVTVRTENRYLDQPVRGYDEVKEGDYVVLTVSDTGTGIPAESIGKIFEPFYTKKTMGRSGTGLGLAIVWGTVQDHQGYIDIRTEIGRGTTFSLYFPVTREERAAQREKTPIAQYMGNGKSILVVDDIAEQRDIASVLLTRLGYRVHAVASGEEAVEYLKAHQADVLVLDMIMSPGMDGLETYQRILEIHPGQKAILVSGFSETERVREAQRLGAGAYVKKPYILEKIGVALRDALAKG